MKLIICDGALYYTKVYGSLSKPKKVYVRFVKSNHHTILLIIVI